MMRCRLLLAALLATSFSARPAAAQQERGALAVAASADATPESRIRPAAAAVVWLQPSAPGMRPLVAAPPPQTYWREGAIFGGILTALPLVAWGLSACEHSCVWRVPMGAVVGALPGAVVGGLIGGLFERR